MAIYLAQVPAAFLLNYQAQILLPVFSQVQSEAERTNSILRKGTSLLLFLVVPALVFVALSGRSLLSLLYGAAYAFGFWPFLIAAIIAAINIANAQLTTAFYAAGKPQLHRQCVAIMALVMLLFIYPAAHWGGTAGAQLCALAAMIVGYAIQLRQARSLSGFRLRISKRLGVRLAGALVVLAIAVLVRGAVSFSTPAFNLLLGGFAAALTLFAGIFLSYRRDRWDIIAT
jgi:O-antigen/teichoic acid export membrane protein